MRTGESQKERKLDLLERVSTSDALGFSLGPIALLGIFPLSAKWLNMRVCHLLIIA